MLQRGFLDFMANKTSQSLDASTTRIAASGAAMARVGMASLEHPLLASSTFKLNVGTGAQDWQSPGDPSLPYLQGKNHWYAEFLFLELGSVQ